METGPRNRYRLPTGKVSTRCWKLVFPFSHSRCDIVCCCDVLQPWAISDFSFDFGLISQWLCSRTKGETFRCGNAASPGPRTKAGSIAIAARKRCRLQVFFPSFRVIRGGRRRGGAAHPHSRTIYGLPLGMAEKLSTRSLYSRRPLPPPRQQRPDRRVNDPGKWETRRAEDAGEPGTEKCCNCNSREAQIYQPASRPIKGID